MIKVKKNKSIKKLHDKGWDLEDSSGLWPQDLWVKEKGRHPTRAGKKTVGVGAEIQHSACLINLFF